MKVEISHRRVSLQNWGSRSPTVINNITYFADSCSIVLAPICAQIIAIGWGALTKIGQLVGTGWAVGLVPEQITGWVGQGKHLAVNVVISLKVVGIIPVNQSLGKNRAGQQVQQQQREQGFYKAKS